MKVTVSRLVTPAPFSFRKHALEVSDHLFFQPGGKNIAPLLPGKDGPLNVKAVCLDANPNLVPIQVD
ncbi:hypothetical protein AOP6_1406 [Desulfuromonas sp. AOP6]|nr:hypothetical protein AOP6_1406 [Desulfuromonas sp. AOP6]